VIVVVASSWMVHTSWQHLEDIADSASSSLVGFAIAVDITDVVVAVAVGKRGGTADYEFLVSSEQRYIAAIAVIRVVTLDCCGS
jgi:hypothetical protein